MREIIAILGQLCNHRISLLGHSSVIYKGELSIVSILLIIKEKIFVMSFLGIPFPIALDLESEGWRLDCTIRAGLHQIGIKVKIQSRIVVPIADLR